MSTNRHWVERSTQDFHQALYRRRDDGDWDLILALGLDAEPTDIFAIGKDYFADEFMVDEFMVLFADNLGDFPDVYSRTLPELFNTSDSPTPLPHSDEWPDDIVRIKHESEGDSIALVTVDDKPVHVVVPNVLVNERMMFVRKAGDIFLLHDVGNGYYTMMASSVTEPEAVLLRNP